MPIVVPADGAVISAGTFGKPVADAINNAAPTPWVNLPFQNSWANYGTYQTGTYRKVGDIVYLRGTLRPGALGAGMVLFSLPAGFRPPVTVEFIIGHTDGGGMCSFYLDATSGNFGFNASPVGLTRLSLNINFSTVV